MRADIAAALAAVTSTANAHANALRALDSVAERKVCDVAAQRAINTARDIVLLIEGPIAEAERPKGPEVRIVHKGVSGTEWDAPAVELARTTANRAIMASGLRFDIATGIEVKTHGRHNHRRHIHADDLPMVRAMKLGPNAVSKALDVIAKDQGRARG